MPVLSIRVFEEIFSTLASKFRPAFSRSAAYENFRLALLTFMTSIERKGVTDTARLLPDNFDFSDRNRCYEAMIKFFKRSDAFDHKSLWRILAEIMRDSNLLYRDKESGRCFLVIDGHNVIKSGRRMPCVGKMTQHSETPSKPKNTFGHLVGSLGVVAGSENTKLSCFLIAGEIQSGEDQIRVWNREDEMALASHIVKMLKMVRVATETFKHCFLLGDSYFFTDPALTIIKHHNALHPDRTIVMISKAKRNCVAWTPPPEKVPGQVGRPHIRGYKVHPWELFDDEDAFTEVTIKLYGKEEKTKYRELILLWGKNYTPVKFVLTVSDRGMAILVCTDTTVDAITIITSYSRRWKVEASFKVSSQDTKAFNYHFWSKAQEKLDRFASSSDPDPLLAVEEKDRKAIMNTFRAYERFISISFIAQSLLQLIALILEERGYESKMWLRTKRGTVVSVGNLIHDLHYLILFGLGSLVDLPKLDKMKKDDSSLTENSHRLLNVS